MMASKCRNIWDSLRSADLSATAVVSSPCNGSASESSLPSSSVTFLLPEPCVKVPFTGNGYGERHSSTSNFSTNCSEERWKRRKYDHNFQRSLQAKPTLNRDGWSCDSRTNCSPYLKAEFLMRNEDSCNLSKVQNFAFEKVDLSSSILPVNSSEVCSVSKSVRSSENNSFHRSASKMKCHRSTEAFPGYPVAVSRRVVNHMRSPILSQAGFGNYLNLNDANYMSVENCVTNLNADQKLSAKRDVTSSKNADIFVIDLICSTAQDCFSKSVAEHKKAQFHDSANTFLEREKNVIHDAVVPVLLPESSCSMDIRCHSNDHDVDMETLSETEDIPSFKCPFDVEELVNVDESYSPGIFLGTGLSRSLPTSHSQTASVSTVAELQSTACDMNPLRTSPVSFSDFVSPVQPISKIAEKHCVRRCIDDKSGSLSQSDNEQILTDKNAYSKLHQLYQSKQLSNDLFHIDEWPKAGFEITKSLDAGSAAAVCGTRSMPRDDGGNLGAARVQLLNGKPDSELDGIRSAVEEVLGFLATDAYPPIDPVSNKDESMQRKTIHDKQRSPELGVPLSYTRESVATSSSIDCNISGPVDSILSPPSARLKTTTNTLEQVDRLNGIILEPEYVKLVREFSLEDSNILNEAFSGENKKPGHNLDLCVEEDPAEIINRRTNLENFVCPSRRPQFLPEFECSADTIRISENAISPCSVYPGDECFLETWSHPSEMLSCTPVHNEGVAKSCSDPSHAAVTYLDGLDLRSGLSEFEGLSVSSTSPLGTEINSNFSLLGGSTRFRVNSSDEKNNLQDSLSESGLSELSENPNYVKTEGGSKKIRRPRMLTEIASSNGFIAERRPSQSSGSLFVDSKLLSREERVLQRVHMQITKMEVKEELIKFKKSKSLADTCDQAVNSRKTVVADKFNRLVSHKKTNRCVRIRPSSKSVINGKRPKNRFLWSSGKFKPQPVFSSFQPQILYSRNTGEKKDKKKENRKLKLAIEARKFQFKNSNSNVTLNDKTLKGCGCEWQNGSTFDVEALYVSVDGTNSFTISPIAFASAVARESVDNFNETDESFRLPVTPFIPSQVRRVIVCHSTGETILHKAARLGYEDVALWCCQSGFVDVNACDNVGYSPLHESCLNSHLRIAQYLIHYGADVNSASGVDGQRPIHEAVESGCLETVRLLLSAGADINLTTYSGKSVLEISKSQQMKEFLRSYLSDLNGLNDEDAETEWQFIPIWSDDPSSHGLDLLCDAPPCDPKCSEFYVEMSASCFEK